MQQYIPPRSNAGHVGESRLLSWSPLAQRQPDLNGVRRLGLPQSVVARRASNASDAVCWAPGERPIVFSRKPASSSRRMMPSSEVASLSYSNLDRRPNRLARHLLARGIESGDHVALMFDGSPETYVAMLAVMKVNAA